jgi:uncharacterized cupredoxin-like copper-binding protein
MTTTYSHVASGTVQFNAYNQGQDPHTFAIVAGTDLNGRRLVDTSISPGSSRTVNVSLAPGTYTLFCSLPGHAASGMKVTITVG